MRETILELLESTGQLDLQTIVLRLLIGTVIAFFIYVSYMLSHEGSIYSKKFNVSLMALTIITTAVMIVIGNNIALSLGMVGALSIVRFRLKTTTVCCSSSGAPGRTRSASKA